MIGYGLASASGVSGIKAQTDLAIMNARSAGLAKTPTGTPKNPAAMQKAAQEFEAMFIGQMLQPMFQSLPTDGLMGGGSSEKVWRSMMVDEYGKSISQQGGIGIADHVLREMIRLQENAQ